MHQDDVIIKQGDVGDFFYVLDTGATRIEVNGKKVAEVGTGGSFGELALMYNAPRAATVVGSSPTLPTYHHITAFAWLCAWLCAVGCVFGWLVDWLMLTN